MDPDEFHRNLRHFRGKVLLRAHLPDVAGDAEQERSGQDKDRDQQRPHATAKDGPIGLRNESLVCFD